MVRVVHAGDFHLDSAFGALTPEQARQRRMESRRTPERLVEWANDHGADLLLLSGDLFDSDSPYGDTAPLLAQALGCFRGQAVIAPGNHDPLTPDGPYARTRWSDNVHIFTEDRMQTITFPDLNCAVHGAGLHRPGVSHGQCTPRLPCAAGRPYPHWSAPWRRYDLRQPLPSDPRGGYRPAAGWTIWRWAMFTAAAAF